MRLLTLDILCCVAESCRGKSSPLILRSEGIKRIEQEFNQDLLERSLESADLDFLRENALLAGLSFPDKNCLKEMDETEKRCLFETLFEQHVEQGLLVCRECQSKYKIINGIPNMVEPIKEKDN